MDKNVNPVAAAIVILLLVASIGGWFWFSYQAKSFGGPAGLVLDPRGHLFIQVQNQLIEHRPDGSFVARHDLGELGVDTLLGDLAFFSNGDLLVRLGDDPRSFLDNLRASERLANPRTLSPKGPGDGLHRCSLGTQQCEPFGAEPIDFNAVHRTFIDWDTDDVFISDSSRHLVRKFSADGAELAAPASGFKFPNQLLIDEGELLVADTNHHRIRRVAPDSERFGEELGTIDVVPAVASENSHIWPGYFSRVGDEWWINNLRGSMDYGGVYVFDANWDFVKPIVLPDNADPLSLVVLGKDVLISDYFGDRVHRLDLEGNRLGDFASSGLESVLAESTPLRQRYQVYSWSVAGLGLVLMVLTVLLGTNWRQKRPEPAAAPPPEQPLQPLVLEPDHAAVAGLKKRFRLGYWLVGAYCLGFLPFFLMALKIETAFLALYFGLGAIAFAALRFTELMNEKDMKTSIRIEAERITLRGHDGTVVNANHRDVYYDNSYILAGDVAVFLGRRNLEIYDRPRIKAELDRRLPPEQRLSHGKMQWKLVTINHHHAQFNLFALVAALFLMWLSNTWD